eukprot:UC4_evm2s923
MANTGKFLSKAKARAIQRKLLSAAYQRVMTSPPYKPPSFASGIRSSVIPSYRLEGLAHLPTPIQPLLLPDISCNDVKLYIKRDDMTGCELSGNKVRKLEFLLADAIAQGCDAVITCGGLQSNHARATAVAARQLGMESHLVLRVEDYDTVHPASIPSTSNLLINKMVDAEIHLAPYGSYKSVLLPTMEKVRKELEDLRASKAYIVAVGGSDPVGIWGYLECFREMLSQGISEKIDDIVVSCGSGGTAAGLAIGNFLTGSQLKVHAISVCDEATYFHKHVDDMLKYLGLDSCTESREILRVVDGYKGAGYALSTDDELLYQREVAQSTGLFFDSVYTLKGVIGLKNEINSNKGMFNGRRILFVHTGGMFGCFDGRIEPFVAGNGSRVGKGASLLTLTRHGWKDL